MAPNFRQEGWKSVHEVNVEDLQAAGLTASQAGEFWSRLRSVLEGCGDSAADAWRRISRELLLPRHPHPVHQLMYYSTYADWDVSRLGPPMVWFPTEEVAANTNVARLFRARGRELLGADWSEDPAVWYPALQRWSTKEPEVYWPLVFGEMSISFHRPPKRILDTSLPGDQWLPGALINAANCCLLEKPEIGKRDSNSAIVWRVEGQDDLPVKSVSYGELRRNVHRVAYALGAAGFRTGDRVGIIMPMTYDAVSVYLAIVLAGCVVVSIADSFAAQEIARRVRIADVKGIFTQDAIPRGGKLLPLYSRVAESGVFAIVIPADGQTLNVVLKEGDLSWEEFLSDSTTGTDRHPDYPAVQLPSQTFSNILFSSGTTGDPKAIPWTHTTPLVTAADGWAHQDVKSEDVFSMPTSLGWMVGPFLIYACFLRGATMAIYYGSPLERSYGKFVQDSRATVLGVVPSMLKTWKKTGCMEGLDWSNIRNMFTTAEASTPDDSLWLCGRSYYPPLLEICGGTEMGCSFVHGSLLQPQGLSLFSTASLGRSFVILNEQGVPYPNNEPCIGEIALLPFMGESTVILNGDHDAVYYKGLPSFQGQRLRRHGDVIERLHGGYYKAHGRADDTMNLGGIKTSSVEIERVCNKSHERVVETAAIALPPTGGGPDQLLLVVVLKPGSELEVNVLKQALSTAIHKELNPLFKVSDVVVVSDFPRTSTGKILRRLLRVQFIHTARSKL